MGKGSSKNKKSKEAVEDPASDDVQADATKGKKASKKKEKKPSKKSKKVSEEADADDDAGDAEDDASSPKDKSGGKKKSKKSKKKADSSADHQEEEEEPAQEEEEKPKKKKKGKKEMKPPPSSSNDDDEKEEESVSQGEEDDGDDASSDDDDDDASSDDDEGPSDETPSEESDRLYKKYMAKVDEHAQNRGRLFEESKAAYDAGDGATAKEKSEAAKKEGALMEKAKNKAARAIYKAKNRENPKGTMDLHGQQVAPAMAIVEQEVAECLKKGMSEVVIIPGKGGHSKDGAKIKPALLEWLEEKGYSYEEESDGGAYRVTIG